MCSYEVNVWHIYSYSDFVPVRSVQICMLIVPTMHLLQEKPQECCCCISLESEHLNIGFLLHKVNPQSITELLKHVTKPHIYIHSSSVIIVSVLRTPYAWREGRICVILGALNYHSYIVFLLWLLSWLTPVWTGVRSNTGNKANQVLSRSIQDLIGRVHTCWQPVYIVAVALQGALYNCRF